MSAGSGDLGVLRWIIDGDDAPLDAKLNSAEAKVRSWASRMAGVTAPIFGGPGGATTFSGNVSGPNVQGGLTQQGAPWGAASPNWSFLLNQGGAPTASPNWSVLLSQQAQQITAGAASLQPTSSPNWSYYFGQLQNQLSAMQPTSSPNWSYLLNQRGGGGGPGNQMQRGIRASLVYHFGQQVAQEALQAEEAHYEFQRVLSRGTLDEQVSAGVAAAKSYDTGLTGAISRFAGAHPIASMAIVSPIPTIINWAQGGTTEDIRNQVESAAAALQGQKASDAARRGTERMGRRVAEIGLSPFKGAFSKLHEDYDEGMDDVRELREKAKQLTGENNQTANAVAAEADSREKMLQSRFGRGAAYLTQHRGLQIAGGYVMQGVAAFGGAITGAAEAASALIAAGGDTYGAQRALTAAEYARQEAGTTNPIARLALKAFHTTMLWSQDAIHQRELTERAEDLGVADEELAARNPYLSSGASYRIRRQALQDKKALELARYKAQNPKDATGAAALSKYYDSETDLLDQQGAMEETQNAIAQSTNLQVGQQLLMRNPRAAAIAAIRGRTVANVIAGGVDENGMPSLTAMSALALGGQQIALENQRQDDRERLLMMSIGGEHDMLQAMLGRTPETAAMSPRGRSVVGSAIQQRVQGQMESEQLGQQGNVLGAIASLGNSIDSLDLLKQNLFQHVEARGVNLNLQDVSHPETSTEDLSKAIAEQRRLLMNDLADRLPQIISDLIQ
jgi:hypothetical protein